MKHIISADIYMLGKQVKNVQNLFTVLYIVEIYFHCERN